MKTVGIQSGTTMRDFGTAETRELVQTAAKQIHRALDDPNEEAVHKMRVSIRRLQQGLRLFGQFLREKGVKSLRRELKQIMVPAGELRNCDIALTIAVARGGVAAVLRYRRQQARTVLDRAVAEVAGTGSLDERWCRKLGLPNEREGEA
jgi:CHAD domain-containing protein